MQENIRDLLRPSDLERMLATALPLPYSEEDELRLVACGALVSFLGEQGDRWEPFHLWHFLESIRQTAIKMRRDNPKISFIHHLIIIEVVTAELTTMTAQGLIRSCPKPYHWEVTDRFIENCIERYNLMLPQ
ncbi:MAG: hypothetical protein HGA31_06430 [Candidatus Moranbacteria bacterium]|nr:hypothetical protein [Candidatus Moranbacteria bacterium]